MTKNTDILSQIFDGQNCLPIAEPQYISQLMFCFQSLIRIQRWFGAWEYEVYSNPDSEPTSCLPPISTLRDVKTTCNGMIALATKCSELGAGLIPGRINQDVVENWFGHQRQACGSNQNMTGKVSS